MANTPSATLEQQYAALTQAVGIAPLVGRTILAVTGSDRVAFLHSFVTNDIKSLSVGGGCEVFVTSGQGKTLGYGLLFCEPGRLVFDTTAGQAGGLISHFERYVITEDVQFADQTEQVSDILVAGPLATSLLAKLTHQEPPRALCSHVPAELAGRAVAIRRVEFAGPMSFFVQVAAGDTPVVMDALLAGGAQLCAADAVEAVRLAAGVPLFGIDVTADNLPQEIGRDKQAISFVKGCYLGQETVARIDAIGHVNRLLVGLKFTGDAAPAAGEQLQLAGQIVGHVTSSARSPGLAAAVAFALLKRSCAQAGTALTSASGSATVVRLPLNAGAALPAAGEPSPAPSKSENSD